MRAHRRPAALTRRLRAAGTTLLAVTLSAVALLAAAPAHAGMPGRVLFRITDPRLDEVSGLAVGVRSPGVLYVQNDSGDRSRFFALDARTGATAATIEVDGARNVDWEDLAVADDPAGTPSVWLADIGDNGGVRDEVRVYRVDEPRIDPARRDGELTATVRGEWRLRYPDGATDAESFAVGPDGVAYLVTKSLLGASTVYRLPASPDPDRVRTLQPVGRIGFSVTGTPGGPDALGQLTATGASFSADGRVFAVRTYTDAYLWPVGGGDLTAALARPPTRIALPAQPQGEGIAVDGRRLLVDSEGTDQPVYAVALPALPDTPAASSASLTRPPASTSPRVGGERDTARGDPDEGSNLLVRTVLTGLGVAAVLAVVGAVRALRRRTGRRR